MRSQRVRFPFNSRMYVWGFELGAMTFLNFRIAAQLLITYMEFNDSFVIDISTRWIWIYTDSAAREAY